MTLQHPICSTSNLQCCQISEEFVWVAMVPNCDLARSNLFSVSALLPDLIRICLSCYGSKWWPCKIQFIQFFCIIARFWRTYLSCQLTKEKVCNLPLLNHSVLGETLLPATIKGVCTTTSYLNKHILQNCHARDVKVCQGRQFVIWRQCKLLYQIGSSDIKSCLQSQPGIDHMQSL